MKVIILGGFLGSGKTTALLKMAQYITKHSKKKMALAIVENEIGENSVDGVALSAYKVKELSSGCICCTLTSDLASAICQIHEEYDPEFVLVEATGLAMVESITRVIRQYVPGVSRLKSVVLVDAYRWDELLDGMEVFFENQLRGADYILLNKCDTVSKEDRDRISKQIAALQPPSEICLISALKDMTNTLEKILEVKS